MAVEKQHNILDMFLFRPGAYDLLRTFGTDILNLAQPVGMVFDDIERI